MLRSISGQEFESVRVPTKENFIVYGENGKQIQLIFCPLSCRTAKMRDAMFAYELSLLDPFQVDYN